MANAETFMEHLYRIPGVCGCCLVREDGRIPAPGQGEDLNVSLILAGGRYINEIVGKMDFGHCHYLCFTRRGGGHYYVFCIGRYFLGVGQHSDETDSEMIAAILRLIARVVVKKSGQTQ